MKSIIALVGAAVLTGTALGAPVAVEITGEVVWNGIGDPPLGGVMPGDSAVVSFMVDSDNFVEGIPGDTRGYIIDHASFSLTLGAVVQGLIDPFPPGETPYFTIVEGFPVSDGFFVSSSPFSPGGVPLEQAPFNLGFNVGYVGETLDSLDILDAVGTYDYDGLTNFGFGIWFIFPDNVVLGIDFIQMTITAEEVTPAAVDIKPGSCPNSFNPKSNGKLPVAVLGTPDFDVTLVDVGSILLSRADGIGGSVAPIWSRIDDVGTPSEGEPCECNEWGGDGYDDLKLKFESEEVAAVLELGMLIGGGQVTEVVLTGNFLDGTPFAGTDCLRIVPVGSGK